MKEMLVQFVNSIASALRSYMKVIGQVQGQMSIHKYTHSRVVHIPLKGCLVDAESSLHSV